MDYCSCGSEKILVTRENFSYKICFPCKRKFMRQQALRVAYENNLRANWPTPKKKKITNAFQMLKIS